MNKVVSFWEAFRFWLKLGFIGFGGPAGQISIMHNELVENKKWIRDSNFMHALNYCMVFPGPEAQRLAVYLGWLLHGTKGGVAAGICFILPSMVIMTILTWLYITYGNVKIVSAVLYGIKPAIIAVVAFAVLKIGQKALKNSFSVLLALAAFSGLYFLKLPFPLIILAAGIVGFIISYVKPDLYAPTCVSDKSCNVPGQGQTIKDSHFIKGTIMRLVMAFFFWIAPLIGLLAWFKFDLENIFVTIGILFTKVALLSFGGAYAMLPYVAQNAIELYGWITPQQMIDSLAIGELAPGPLIKIVAFVGFLGVWQNTEFGLTGAVIGGFLATYYVFLPSFFIVLVGAPINEATRGVAKLSAALSSITAAIVGVILSITVYFISQVIFTGPAKIDVFALLIASAAFLGLWKLKLNIVYIIITSGLAGMIYKMLL